MHACVFSRRCLNRASLAQKFVRLGAHVGAVVLLLADLRRLSLSHTWLCSALFTTVSSSALFDAIPSCPHALSGPVLRTYVSDPSTQSPDALFSIVLKPPTGVFPTTDRPPTDHRPTFFYPRPVVLKKKKKFVFTTWHLGDANRALYNLGSRLGNWEMLVVPSNLFGTRAKKWGLYVYISIYIILWTINTSTTNIPAAATYMTALPRVTTREWFPARRPCDLHVLHSFSPWDCSHSFPCNLCLSFPRRHTALVSPIPTFGLSAFVARSFFSWGLPPPKMDLRLYDGRLTDYLGEAVVWTVICWLQHKIAL